MKSKINWDSQEYVSWISHLVYIIKILEVTPKKLTLRHKKP